MNPILKSMDVLQVVPYNQRKIRRGDVIIFIPPGSDHKVTHRVISIDSEGIRTRGDNNRHVDPYVLTLEDIVGRVSYVQRRKRRLRIYGGLMGHLLATAVRVIHLVDLRISAFFSPAYHLLTQSRIFRQLTSAFTETRILSFKRPNGTELQLLMGQRIIGRLLPGEDQWQIRRPFRFFVNESFLPDNNS